MNVKSVQPLQALSTVLGWIYVLAWSASFYPQPLLNCRQRSTSGLSIDFPTLNVLGFISYTVSTACFLYSPRIRAEYATRHPLSPTPTVRFNDFAFAVHALVLVALTYSQFFPRLWKFDVSEKQRMSPVVRMIVYGSGFSVLAGTLVVALRLSRTWQWIDVVYIFGHIKLVATFVKYIPQAWLNYQRKSTQGWSIGQILFDLVGGVLSITQLLIDASFQGDWTGITGNAVKFGLGNVSICFDLIFITQHYVLYRRHRDGEQTLGVRESEEPLLPSAVRD